jgi:hypothetical protein
MGRKVYGSGLVASDLASDRQPNRRRGQSPATLKQHVSGPEIDDSTRVKAAVKVSGAEDRELLWEALGLDEMLDRRREQLGLPSLFPEHTRTRRAHRAKGVPIEGDQQ